MICYIEISYWKRLDCSRFNDLGLYQPPNEEYGVLPYVAPEVLKGKEYSKASGIYGFGNYYDRSII
jgi:hypothetical protein